MGASIIELIRDRISGSDAIHDMAEGLSPAPQMYPPIELADIEVSENRLRVELPLLLKQIYIEIGNGGFGPGYGLLGIRAELGDDRYYEAIDDAYEYMTDTAKDRGFDKWPAKIIPICNWGCDIYSFLDCSRPEYPVVVFNPDTHVVDNPLQVTVTDENGKVIEEYDFAGQSPKTGPPRGQQSFVKPLIIPHKASFEEWISDWARGVDLWAEMERL
jgi:hypothetical protein